jgi:(R,R)-butanediol dehydrogenase/meso-butanediol dehydrogenase/diacetyl reductase
MEEAEMKAAVWHHRRDVRIEQVQSPPRPPAGQLQVKVSWCGICGTDLHEYSSGPIYIPVEQPHPLTGVQAPVIIGHEMSGEVVDLGEGVEGFAVGDRVAACPIIGCGSCRWCRSGSMAQCDRVAFLGSSWTGGALAERVNLHAYQCFRLPQSIPDDAGALVEPFSAVVRALHRSAPKPEERVAVVGAGPMGLMSIMAARIIGCAHVVSFEVAERRRHAAKLCGAEENVDPATEDAEKRGYELTGGQGFDLVVECAGIPATALLAGRLARTRGRVMLMGVFDKPAALDLTDIVFREKTVMGSMSGYGMYEETIAMIANPLFLPDVLITERIGLDRLVDIGYRGLLEEKHKHIKTLVKPG